jgi:hypothetical protein
MTRDLHAKWGQATFSATALSGTGSFLYFKKLPVPHGAVIEKVASPLLQLTLLAASPR